MNGHRLKQILFSTLYLGLGMLFVSCTSDNKTNWLLQQAELCMEAHPDSALHLLEQVQEPNDLNDKTRALYFLLLAQARDKNYLDMSADSSVIFSVNYFRKKDDKKRYGKSLYYYGRVVQTVGEGARAMTLFLNACHALEGTGEDKTMGLAYANMSAINCEQSLYDESLRCCRQAIDYYTHSDNLLNAAFTYQTMGRTFFLMEEMDSVYWCATNSLQLLADNPVRLRLGANKLLGRMYTYQKKYPQAEKVLWQVLHEDPDSSNSYYHNMALGHLYMLMERTESAKEFLSICTDSPDLFTRSDAYGCLSELAKKAGNFKEALQFKEKEDSLFSLAENEEKRGELIQLQTQYEKEKLNSEKLQVRMEKQRFHLFYIALLGLAIGFLYYLYRKYWHARKMLYKVRKTIENNKYRILLLQNEINSLQDKRQTKFSEAQNKINDLQKNIEKLANQNERRSQNTGENINIISLIKSLKNGQIIAERISDQEWNRIFDLVNSLYFDSLTRLEKDDLRHTKRNIQLLSLLLLGFSNKELMIIFDHKDLHCISKAKGRLKERLGLSKERTLEEFLQNSRVGK